jgi:hypothetical protein
MLDQGMAGGKPPPSPGALGAGLGAKGAGMSSGSALALAAAWSCALFSADDPKPPEMEKDREQVCTGDLFPVDRWLRLTQPWVPPRRVATGDHRANGLDPEIVFGGGMRTDETLAGAAVPAGAAAAGAAGAGIAWPGGFRKTGLETSVPGTKLRR